MLRCLSDYWKDTSDTSLWIHTKQSCLLLPYETSSSIHGVCSGVCLRRLIKYYLRGFSTPVKAVMNRCLFYCCCLFCFSGAEKGRLVLTWLVDLTLKLIIYLNPLCYVRLPKAFEGIIWGSRSRVGAHALTLKSHWADGATLDISQTVQS